MLKAPLPSSGGGVWACPFGQSATGLVRGRAQDLIRANESGAQGTGAGREKKWGELWRSRVVGGR